MRAAAVARGMGGQGLAFGPFLINKTSNKLCSFPLFNAVIQQHMGAGWLGTLPPQPPRAASQSEGSAGEAQLLQP